LQQFFLSQHYSYTYTNLQSVGLLSSILEQPSIHDISCWNLGYRHYIGKTKLHTLATVVVGRQVGSAGRQAGSPEGCWHLRSVKLMIATEDSLFEVECQTSFSGAESW